jgi:hypothetical protein
MDWIISSADRPIPCTKRRNARRRVRGPCRPGPILNAGAARGISQKEERSRAYTSHIPYLRFGGSQDEIEVAGTKVIVAGDPRGQTPENQS